jgi:non-ribosomal peptide synthetase component F
VGLPHFYSNLFCSVKSLIQWSAVAFDVHISDFMQCWMYGSTLYMLRPDGNVDFQYLTKMAKTYGIGSIQMVPSLARAWLQYLVDSNDCVTLRSLDCLCFIGEALSSQLLLDLRAGNALPRRLINAYGPAECFLCDTVRICDETDLHLDSDRPVGVPIGRSCQGASCFVVDPVSLELLPAGQMGELCIGGPVMLGYHNQPELTARAVIDHARFGRLYRTGDMARVSWHGDLRFEGRVDNQVKINGQRTELEEIENVLLTAVLDSSAIEGRADSPSMSQFMLSNVAVCKVVRSHELGTSDVLVAFCVLATTSLVRISPVYHVYSSPTHLACCS